LVDQGKLFKDLPITIMKLVRISLLTVIASTQTMILTSKAAAVLVFNGDFESPNPAAGTLYVGTSIPGWTVVGRPGANAVQGEANPSGNWPGNTTQTFDVSGYSGGAGILSDPFPTTPGQKYEVTFDAFNGSLVWPGAAYTGPAISLEASGGPLVTFFGGTDLPAGVTERLRYSFTATAGSTTLTFMEPAGIDSNGAWMDNVAISVVPEPDQYVAAFGVALLGTGVWLRRKKV